MPPTPISTEPSEPSRPHISRRRSVRRTAAASAVLAALLAVTVTACGPSDDKAGSSASAEHGTGGLKLPKGIPTSLDDLKKWKDGGWKNWDNWARKAKDFANPVIKGHWNRESLSQAKAAPDLSVKATDAGSGLDGTDAEPRPVNAQQIPRPYHQNMAPVGKVFFNSPQGPMVCSGTIVSDPAHPGKSNLVWTAGHCVHSGKKGGWMRNIIFVPSYNDYGAPMNQVNSAPQQQVTPYGRFWADWISTSGEWMNMGDQEHGSAGSAYDFAVLHVKPENGSGKSLEETVGTSVPIWFNAPDAHQISGMKAVGYPAGPPYDGARMMNCLDRPGRFTMQQGTPPMDRIGCTMTGGSSGGGWFANRGGKLALVSNTSISSAQHTWLAGPRLGPEAQRVFDGMSRKFAGQ
ncbi:trypsin-like serine peptidase [Streptomyces natalensis]|nr:hypothetical protein [Streptomyces natalensis]